MKKLIVSVFMILVTFSCAKQKSESTDLHKMKFYPFQEGIDIAIKEKKPVFIDFYTDWCHWCHELDKKTFSHPPVIAKVKSDFIAIRINAENGDEKFRFMGKDYTPITFTQAMGVTGFPSILFLDGNQKPITILPGFVDGETFKHILDYVKTESYSKNIPFDQFMEKQKQGKK